MKFKIKLRDQNDILAKKREGIMYNQINNANLIIVEIESR